MAIRECKELSFGYDGETVLDILYRHYSISYGVELTR